MKNKIKLLEIEIEIHKKKIQKLEEQFTGLAKVFKGMLEVAKDDESAIIKPKSIMEV
jgi:hypothetical protein